MPVSYNKLWKLMIEAKKTLNKCLYIAPFRTGNLQDSIQIDTNDADEGILTIYINDEFYESQEHKARYYRYLNEDDDKHYQRGQFKGQSTKGWWDRMCDKFAELWKNKASRLEDYERKETDDNASASEHKQLAEKGQIRKLEGGKNFTKDEVINQAKTFDAKTKRTEVLSVKEMQKLSVENMQQLLIDSLGVKITKGFSHNKREFYKMRRELFEVRDEYGEVQIGGMPVRTIIRELVRKLWNSEHVNAL